MHRGKPIHVSEILALLLENGGIRCTTPPVLYMWEDSGKVARKIEIKTLPEFLSLFGNRTTYQVYVERPSIGYLDRGRFAVKSLSIVTTYRGGGKWSEPRIQTEEEEITRDYSRRFREKAGRRAVTIGKRVQSVLTVLSILLEAYKILEELKG